MTDVVKLPALVGSNWSWQIKGACREVGVDTFFNPENERGRAKRLREAAAKAVCAECVVVQKCLDWALSVREPYGVWGGTSPADREAILNDVRNSASPATSQPEARASSLTDASVERPASQRPLDDMLSIEEAS